MKNKKLEAVLLAAILLLSLGLRLAFLFVVPQPPLQYDAISYDAMVRQIIEDHFYAYQQGEPNAFTTPGYPIFLTIIYKVFGYADGSPLMAVRVVQILLSVLTIYLL
jgi:4-amino-4-deoxy-L-arabinose transferase-like glycosyltransferase